MPPGFVGHSVVFLPWQWLCRWQPAPSLPTVCRGSGLPAHPDAGLRRFPTSRNAGARGELPLGTPAETGLPATCTQRGRRHPRGRGVAAPCACHSLPGRSGRSVAGAARRGTAQEARSKRPLTVCLRKAAAGPGARCQRLRHGLRACGKVLNGDAAFGL